MALDYEVRSEYQNLPLEKLLSAPVTCFQGVGDNQKNILKKYFNITTVQQLGNLPFFIWALGVQEMALKGGASSEKPVEELSKKDTLNFSIRPHDRGKSTSQLFKAPVHVLEGLTPDQDLALYDAFRVTNIVQLAQNRIMLEARVIEYLANNKGRLGEEGASKQEIASILGAGTVIPTPDDLLAGGAFGKDARVGDISDHLQGRIDALKGRAADRMKDIGDKTSEPTEKESIRRPQPTSRVPERSTGGGRTDSIAEMRKRTEATRIQSITARVEAQRMNAGAGGASKVPAMTIKPRPTPSSTTVSGDGVSEEAATAMGAANSAALAGSVLAGSVLGESSEGGGGAPPEETQFFPGQEGQGDDRTNYKPWIAGAAVLAIVVTGVWVMWPEGSPPTTTQTDPTVADNQASSVTQPGKSVAVTQTGAIRGNHLVKRGESLWRIARTEYDNPLLWKKIYQANKDVIEDPDLIFPNQNLKIPSK